MEENMARKNRNEQLDTLMHNLRREKKLARQLLRSVEEESWINRHETILMSTSVALAVGAISVLAWYVFTRMPMEGELIAFIAGDGILMLAIMTLVTARKKRSWKEFRLRHPSEADLLGM